MRKAHRVMCAPPTFLFVRVYYHVKFWQETPPFVLLQPAAKYATQRELCAYVPTPSLGIPIEHARNNYNA